MKATEWVVKGLNVKMGCISYDYCAVGSGGFPLGFAKQNEQFYIVTLFERVAVPKKKGKKSAYDLEQFT